MIFFTVYYDHPDGTFDKCVIEAFTEQEAKTAAGFLLPPDCVIKRAEDPKNRYIKSHEDPIPENALEMLKPIE